MYHATLFFSDEINVKQVIPYTYVIILYNFQNFKGIHGRFEGSLVPIVVTELIIYCNFIPSNIGWRSRPPVYNMY